MVIKKKKRILVLTDHMPWGHRSIAKAIYSYLLSNLDRKKCEIIYREVKADTGVAEDIYKFIYKYYPQIGAISYKLSNKNKFWSGKIEKDLAERNLSGVKHVVRKIQPDLIISAYFLHTQSLVKWRKAENKKFKLWTVIADPWTFYPISFVKEADFNFVYDDVGVEMGKSLGVKPEKIVKTGWWVRPEMHNKYNREAARKKLGFTDNRPVIFVGGGSLGTNALMKILPVLFLVKKEIGLVFNTGTDKAAFKLVENYIKLFRKFKRNNLIQIKNLGWIDNMAEVLAASDIVFGKAGPNFLFDVVATEKPFVAITHICGQEDGNLELIRKKGLGWVKEKNREMVKFFLEYIKNSEEFNNKFRKNLKAESENNKKSLPLIGEMVKRELGI